MIVDQDKRYLFLHVPKTAGTSMQKVMVAAGATKIYKHCWAYKAKDEIDAEIKTFDDLFKFAFVRNPFDRVASWYLWWIAEGLYDGTFEDFITEDRPVTAISSNCCSITDIGY